MRGNEAEGWYPEARFGGALVFRGALVIQRVALFAGSKTN